MHKPKNKKAAHRINAWACSNQVIQGQLKTDKKRMKS